MIDISFFEGGLLTYKEEMRDGGGGEKLGVYLSERVGK